MPSCCRACSLLADSSPRPPVYSADSLPTKLKRPLRWRRTDALICMRMRVYVLLDLANVIANFALTSTSTSPMSRWFGISTRWCERRPVCAPLSRHNLYETLGRKYTRRGDVNATSRASCFVQVLATTGCGRCSVLSLEVGCRLLWGAQSQPPVELFMNRLPNGPELLRGGRWQNPKQDDAP